MGSMQRILPRKKEKQIEYICDINRYSSECFVNFDYKIIGVATLKGGSRSLYNCMTQLKINEDEESTGSLNMDNFDVFVNKKPFSDFTKITTCRDPYLRFVSIFHEMVLMPDRRIRHDGYLPMYGTDMRYINKISVDYLRDQVYSFLVWLRYALANPDITVDPHCYPQYIYHRNFEFDDIIRLENFKEEFLKIIETKGIEWKGIDSDFHIHKTKENTNLSLYSNMKFTDWLCEESIEIINDIYFVDFETYKYEQKTFKQLLDQERGR